MSNTKKAIITGVAGQDGSYLAEFLLQKGYKVLGIVKKEALEYSNERLKNILHIINDIELISLSLTDAMSVYKILKKFAPDEIYHLAANSFVNYELENEIDLMSINFNSTYYLMSSVNELNKPCKFFFAGSSEMFGEPYTFPQNENNKFNPKSIYGLSKVASYYLLKNFRDKKGLFACTGIMYNHESHRRGNQFVTKKIISTAVKIKYGLESKLELGNLEAKRDWGYAPDYVYAMWLILQQKKPSDYIVATGELHTVKEFLQIVFDYLNIDVEKYVMINNIFFRQSEKIPLVGNANKIKKLGWKPTKNFEEIIHEMIISEIENIRGK